MRRLAPVLSLFWLMSCETPHIEPIQLDDIENAPVIAFIKDGVTTRQQVLLNLGTPSAQFEGERILTYQLRADSEDQVRVFWPRRSEIHPILTDWQRDIFSLVLVFDSSGTLLTHSIVGAN